ncbi:MAG: hypothetical protein HQL90_08525 [Magnetococcales bacterium]|nr:hypothetical protein [Magnetococcales bacterium]
MGPECCAGARLSGSQHQQHVSMGGCSERSVALSGVVQRGGGSRERSGSSLERRAPSRSERGGVLIACGPRASSYLASLLRYTRLEERVTLSSCSEDDPAAVVAQGIQHCRTRGPFRRFYAVVCCGSKAEAQRQLAHAPGWDSIGYDLNFQWIVSVPSFHFWLLLHQLDLPLKGWADDGQLSRWIDDQLARRFPADLSSDADQLFKLIDVGLTEAISRGQRLARLQSRSPTLLPMTHLHEMVSYLLKLQSLSLRMQD